MVLVLVVFTAVERVKVLIVVGIPYLSICLLVVMVLVVVGVEGGCWCW